MKVDYINMLPIEVYDLVCAGKIKKFPNNYLDAENVKEILRCVILKRYKYNREQVCKLNIKFFRDNCLGGARKLFGNSVYNLVNYCFPEWEIKRWEFGTEVNKYFWVDEKNRTSFVKWVANKEGISLSCKQDIRKLNCKVMNKYGSRKAIKYAGGIYNLVKPALEKDFKEWELYKVIDWSDDKVKEAMYWLINEKLHLTEQQICNLKVADFVKYNLDGMLQKYCNHSILKALQIAYPGKFVRKHRKCIILAE